MGTCELVMMFCLGYETSYNGSSTWGYNYVDSGLPLCIRTDNLNLPIIALKQTDYMLTFNENNVICGNIGYIENSFSYSCHINSVICERLNDSITYGHLFTTNNTPTTIYTKNFSDIDNILFNACITGIDSLNGDSVGFFIRGLAKRSNSSVLSFVGTPEKTSFKDASLSNADVNVCLFSNDYPDIQRMLLLVVCGVNSKSMVWFASVDALKPELYVLHA